MLHHLILVPTEMERRVLAPLLGRAKAGSSRVELCGFGMVAAAARTARLLADLGPTEVILVGIAGRYGEHIPLGAARCFDRVACHGIGVGTGADFIPAGRVGWPQWPGDPLDPASSVGDLIDLTVAPSRAARQAGVPRAELLLTVASAAAGADDVRLRGGNAPEACAEDMEGFAVALACRLGRVPCTVVRGISNTAGDRDVARWRTHEALGAAATLVRQLVESDP
jgi:futalosine hydrolase